MELTQAIKELPIVGKLLLGLILIVVLGALILAI
jgi:hypothetical protein